MIATNRNNGIFDGADRWALFFYGMIVLVGTLSIFSSTYSPHSTLPFWSFETFYVKQFLWVAIALVSAMVILLLDEQIYHITAHYLYVVAICVLALTLVAGSNEHGAKAWFKLGPLAVQPIEFAKIATALMMARVMSEYSFSIERFGDLMKVGLIILIPFGITVLQNDFGSGVVLGSFLFVLYREGLNKWYCIPILVAAVLFILSIILSPLCVLMLSLSVCILSEAMMTGEWKSRIIFMAWIILASMVIFFVAAYLHPGLIDGFVALLIASIGGLLVAVIYAFRLRLGKTFVMLAIFAASLGFHSSTDYIFNNVLVDHQQDRLKSWLGIAINPKEAAKIEYNVKQSKIAIGSGGLVGKGLLNGTQIQYGFVPKNHTDFIFCVVGEEWGLFGTTLVLILFGGLILRLMRMGERQEEPFGRIYCYCVAAILLFHVLVNIGMTIGLVPVMGIPLPMMSYGGSSLLAFTLLIFIAIRLDASTRQFTFNRI